MRALKLALESVKGSRHHLRERQRLLDRGSSDARDEKIRKRGSPSTRTLQSKNCVIEGRTARECFETFRSHVEAKR
jgi:hypothetical protein